MNNCEKNVILIGGGGHATSLYESFGDTIIGYTALSPTDTLPIEWLGKDEDELKSYHPNCFYHVAYVYSGHPSMQRRKEIIEKYEKKGLSFISLKSISAIITNSTTIGNGCAIMPGVILNKVTLGKHVVVNTGAIIDHDTEVGDNSFIGPGVVIGGYVKIGKDCFIGLGAKIRNGVSISNGVTVGMGSIITKSIVKSGTYYGVI